jgi:thioredoxin-like negative regulator of GroEL
MNKLIIFSASWCRPCKRLKKTLESLKDDSNIIVYDIDINAEKAIEWRISAVPTIILVNNQEEEIQRTLGDLPKEKLLELLNA